MLADVSDSDRAHRDRQTITAADVSGEWPFVVDPVWLTCGANNAIFVENEEVAIGLNGTGQSRPGDYRGSKPVVDRRELIKPWHEPISGQTLIAPVDNVLKVAMQRCAEVQ